MIMLWLGTKERTQVYIRKGLKAWLTRKGVRTTVEAQIKLTLGLLRPPQAACVKTGLTVAYKLGFWWSFYVWKLKEKPFLVALISAANLSGVIRNHPRKLASRICHGVTSPHFGLSALYLVGAHSVRIQGVLHDPRGFINSHRPLAFEFCFSSICLRTVIVHQFVKPQLISLIIHL